MMMMVSSASDHEQAHLAPRLVDALYNEALLLAAEARAYFDRAGRQERDLLDPQARVAFACESLRVTTRIMHVTAWSLTARAARSADAHPLRRRVDCRLGNASPSEPSTIALMPRQAQRLIIASSELYERVKRIDQRPVADGLRPSPARALMGRLERDFAATAA